MNMKYLACNPRTIFLIVSFLFSHSNSFSNEPVPQSDYKIWIMGVPQHLIQHGVRIEIDRPHKGNKGWITYAPTIYYRDENGFGISNRNRNSTLKGAGLDIIYKWFTKPGSVGGCGIYVSPGVGYRYILKETKGLVWEAYQQNDLTFYTLKHSSWNVETHTISFRAVFGFQDQMRKHTAFDYFVGTGIKLSEEKRPENTFFSKEQRDNSRNQFSYGFSGPVFIFGIRVGVGW